MTNCEWKYKFTTFSYFLSCKFRPKEFIDHNIFYTGYDKSEIKKKKETKIPWSRNSSYSDSYHIEGLRLFTSQQISSAEKPAASN